MFCALALKPGPVSYASDWYSNVVARLLQIFHPTADVKPNNLSLIMIMAHGFQSYNTLLGVLFLAAATLAADENITIKEERVGWKEGPNTRGTLSLVWSCGITIFACTWTITHLNVPSRKDSRIRTLIRQIKWMLVNIIFPELILSKAICDLRQALDELRQLDQSLADPNIRDQTTRTERYTSTDATKNDVSRRRFWVVQYPRFHKFFYRLLCLELPGTISRAISPAIAPRWALYKHDAPQQWTVFHSYYAQMGGILRLSFPLGSEEHYTVITATKLTKQHFWDANNVNEHPLKYLELSQRDIQDKSKADWFLKSLSMLQILWLVLNVGLRGTTGLHVTQLEIATVSFAVMAILTYLASWWKPKDISQPTYVYGCCTGRWESAPQTRQLSVWFRSPAQAADSTYCAELHNKDRVPNDVIWMGVETSSMTLLLAISSLLFGGLHCLAWNFEFASRTELIAWRVACVVTTVLPSITLGISTLLSYLSNGRFDTQRQHILSTEFNKLPEMSQDWWNRFLSPSFVCSLQEDVMLKSDVDSILDGSKSWSQICPNSSGTKFGLPGSGCVNRCIHTQYDVYETLHTELTVLRNLWTKASKLDELARDDLKFWMGTCGLMQDKWNRFPDDIHRFWHQFEIFVCETSDKPGFGNQDFYYIEGFLQAYRTVRSRFKEELLPRQRNVWKASRTLSAISYVMYTGARLLAVVLVFTSLRAVPAEVYQVTPWVNFLPKIS